MQSNLFFSHFIINSLFGSNMHAAYGNGMPMSAGSQLQQQQLQSSGQQAQQQQQQQQQQQTSSKLAQSSAGSPSSAAAAAAGYNSYFSSDNVMCRPVH